MSTTTMHFGPEWMRAKQPHAAVRPHAVPSPPPATIAQNTASGGSLTPQGASSYSALLTPPVPPTQVERDIAHPFKYSRDEILQVWKDGGGRGPLPIEVELWEGVVRESAGEPACLRDLTDAEKKLFAMGLNSELRRRQSTDFMAQGERGKLHHSSSSHGGALRDGLGIMGRRRRGDSTGADQPPLSLPRKTSWSANASSLVSPSLPSPRTRIGNGPTSGSFDGVLSGSDNPWSSGKSRGLSGQVHSGRPKEGEPSKDIADSEIKEEEESSESNVDNGESRPSGSEAAQASTNSVAQQEDTNGLSGELKKLSINPNPSEPPNITSSAVNPGQNGTHWDETQFASVQWSYVDPAGNIQGPFTGETMQSWHNQHYFTDDLMMKRTSVDVDFMPLAEVKRRAQGERIFLCPLSDAVPPPGLRQGVPPGLNTLLQRIESPSQPSPQSFGRSSTLDSYLTGVQAASPASSFGGGGLARPSISPDPLAMGSRLPNARFVPDIPLSGRVSAGSYSSTGSPAMPQAIRSVFNEGLGPVRQSSFDSAQYNTNVLANIPWQTPLMNGPGWNGVQEGSPLVDPFGHPIAPGNGQSPFLREPQYNAPMGPAAGGAFPISPEQVRIPYDQQPSADIIARAQQRDEAGFTQISTPSRFTCAPQQLSISPLATDLGRDFDQASSPVVSPWGVPEPQRPRPFDPDHPTAANTFISTPATSTTQSAWPRLAEVHARVAHVPWLADQQAKPSETWGQITDEPQGLDVMNKSQQIEPNEITVVEEKPRELRSEVSVPVVAPPEPAPTVPARAKQPSSAKKESSEASPAPAPSKKKAAAPVQAASPEPPQPTPPPIKPTPAVSPSSQQKSAWSMATDDEKSKPTAPMGLREIQEAEKKKQGARKVAEIERERAARAATTAASSSEDVQFTASWGLPTSRAGARNDGVPVSKDSAPSPSTPATPVWTNAAKPAAKAMKEILEEEERRKLHAAKEKETIVSAAKRAAQGVPQKLVVASVPPSGGAWTTVGTGGKPTVTAAAATSRSTSTTQTPSSASASSTRPAATPVRQAVVSQISKGPTPKAEEAGTPSPEFLKWMRDSLRGLNSSVQFEEIAQILLSFPLDPDPSTVEIIAETVYGASTTLDGRRFASEFIAKRKADASSRRGAPGLSDTNGRPASLADVVKAQPKPVQNDFGGYKVVKKKNKGGRS